MSEINGIEKINISTIIADTKRNTISKSFRANDSDIKTQKSIDIPTSFDNQKSDNLNEIRNASEVLSDIQKVKDSVLSINERLLQLKKHIDQSDVQTCWRNYRSYVEQEMQWLKGKTDSEDNNFNESLSEDRKRLLQIESNSPWRIYRAYIEEKLKWLKGEVDYLV